MTGEPPLKNDAPSPQAWSRADVLRLLLPAAVVIAGAVFALGRAGDSADRSEDRSEEHPTGDGFLAGAELVGGVGGVQPTEQFGSITALRPDVTVELKEATPPEPSSQPPALTELAGAGRIGGGGAVHPNVAPISRLEGASIDDLDLFEATRVAADADGGLWILVEGEAGTGRRPLAHGGRSTVMRLRADRVDHAREIPPATQAWLLTAGSDSDVTVAARRAAGGDLTVLGRDPTGLEDRPLEGLMENLQGTTGGGGTLGPVTITDDDTIVVAHRNRARIDAIAPDDDVRHLLGVASLDGRSNVEVAPDRSLGRITSMVALPGDRVAFTTRRRGMRVLDGGKLPRVKPRPNDPDRTVRLLGPAPDGLLLALAAGAETHPQIQVIDPDTGDVDVVADLVDVAPHPEGPRDVAGALWNVSATAAGRDLVFLADGLLWRLPDAFDTQPSVKK